MKSKTRFASIHETFGLIIVTGDNDMVEQRRGHADVDILLEQRLAAKGLLPEIGDEVEVPPAWNDRDDRPQRIEAILHRVLLDLAPRIDNPPRVGRQIGAMPSIVEQRQIDVGAFVP